ncbi:hypothetical protein IF2G_08807 [Cordyceps javanica]|nr:hypothetical protein IF2G_08807 [Cordyceps javanica]
MRFESLQQKGKTRWISNLIFAMGLDQRRDQLFRDVATKLSAESRGSTQDVSVLLLLLSYLLTSLEIIF